MHKQVRGPPEDSAYSMCLDGGGNMDASSWPTTHHPLLAENQGSIGGSSSKSLVSDEHSTAANLPPKETTAAWSGGCSNPFAVGHLVNHSGGKRPNVEAISFCWRHVPLLPQAYAEGIEGQTISPSSSASYITPPSGPRRYEIPNQIVSGFWYVCPTDGSRVMLPDPPAGEADSVLRGVRCVHLRI